MNPLVRLLAALAMVLVKHLAVGGRDRRRVDQLDVEGPLTQRSLLDACRDADLVIEIPKYTINYAKEGR